MSQPSGHPSEWVRQARQGLTDAGYRRGGARRAIIDLLDEQVCALSASEIQHELAARNREVSRASVYRILEELEELMLVQRVEVCRGLMRYEPARNGPGHHHHLVCERCGRLEPFTDEGLERAIRKASERLPLQVCVHEIVMRGDRQACVAA